MSASTPNVRLRARVEALIRVLALPLDVLLAVGDRASRVLAREDADSTLARMEFDGESAPRGLRVRG
jgi:hypothetical protein